RQSASPSARTRSVLQTWQHLGKTISFVPRVWSLACSFGGGTTSVIFGMTSPPRSTETKSPILTPRRSISSALWSVARVTVVPPMKMGASAAPGGDLSCAANLKEDVFELGDAGACGELVGNGPARGFAGEAEA